MWTNHRLPRSLPFLRVAASLRSGHITAIRPRPAADRQCSSKQLLMPISIGNRPLRYYFLSSVANTSSTSTKRLSRSYYSNHSIFSYWHQTHQKTCNAGSIQRFGRSYGKEFALQSNHSMQCLSTSTSMDHQDKKDESETSSTNTLLPIQSHREKPPPVSKMLSILFPEYKWLTLAVGALTLSTAATMQFPNAIGSMIDILNGVDAATAVAVDAATQLDATKLVRGDAVSSVMDQKTQMNSIAVEMMGYFTVGAICTAIHSAMFDSVGQVSQYCDCAYL